MRHAGILPNQPHRDYAFLNIELMHILVRIQSGTTPFVAGRTQIILHEQALASGQGGTVEDLEVFKPGGKRCWTSELFI